VRFVPALVWTAVVIVLAVLPPDHRGLSLAPPTDKVLHAVEFFMLALLLTWGMANTTLGGLFLRLLVAVPIMTALAVVTEIVQSWVPGRSAELMDLVGDAVGILAGVLAVVVVETLRRGRRMAKG
jgi:VanZ family protein